MSGTWTFVLCDATGSALAELSTASGRSIAFKRNSYAEVQLTLSHEDDAAALLLSALMGTGVPKLKGYRRGSNDAATAPATLRFRGYLAALSEVSEETSLLTATFRSPFGVLIGDGDKAGRFIQGQFPLVYSATDAGAIAKALIDVANTDSLTGLATDPSLIAATKVRDRTYPVAQNIGAAVTDLAAVLDGYDFYETFVDGANGTTQAGPTLTGAQTAGIWVGPSGITWWSVTARLGGRETAASNEFQFASVINGFTPTITLSWSVVPGAIGYNIYRSATSGGESTSPALVGSVGPGVTTFNDTGFTATAGAAPIVGSAVVIPDALFNVVASLGIVNSTARFEYGPTTLANVQHLDRTTTPPVNSVFVTGGNGLTSTYIDTTSVAKYGKWWGTADFSTIIDQPVLDDKAKALCRPNPVKTVSFVPDLALSPLPFDNWNLGDTVPFYARRGALTENTQLRINGFTIPIDENGNETVEVRDPTSPEEDAVTRASLIAEVVAS